MEVNTLKDDKLGRILLCVSSVSAATPYEYTVLERSDLRLLMVVLAYIFMKGGEVFENVLFGFLDKLDIADEPHEDLGYFKRLINETFVRQLYLRKSTVRLDAGDVEDR